MTFPLAHIRALATHPLKGFTPHPLQSAELTKGGVFPLDRAYAVENGPCGFDPQSPQHISKSKFLVLARFAEVAQIKCTYDLPSHGITLTKPGEADLTLKLNEADDQKRLIEYLTRHMGDKAQGPLNLLYGDQHAFTDTRNRFVHAVNLESVRHLSASMGTDIDPQRFRSNIYIDGIPALQELEWMDRILISSAGVEFKCTKPTRRCAAVDVNPTTAERDTDINKALYAQHKHMNVGIYLEVLNNGTLKVGDTLTIK